MLRVFILIKSWHPSRSEWNYWGSLELKELRGQRDFPDGDFGKPSLRIPVVLTAETKGITQEYLLFESILPHGILNAPVIVIIVNIWDEFGQRTEKWLIFVQLWPLFKNVIILNKH